MMGAPTVGIIIGSASDAPHAEKAGAVLRELGIEFEVGVASAHRTPQDAANYAAGAEERGIVCLIAMAGMSAALPGVIAAHTTLPVIGVPIASGHLDGVDALLSVAQMPPGVPVAATGIDAAKNAALLAARILSIRDGELARRLAEWGERAAKEARASRAKIADMGLPTIPDCAYKKPTPF